MTFRTFLLDNLDLRCDFGSLHIFLRPLLCETAKGLEMSKAPTIRACKLGIRQPQTGSFRAKHRCLYSEYISSIPAPGASLDTKTSLFAVRSSFARGIFRPDDIEKSGNTCCIPGFFCDGWAEKGLAKPIVSLICTPFRVGAFGAAVSFVPWCKSAPGSGDYGAGSRPRGGSGGCTPPGSCRSVS